MIWVIAALITVFLFTVLFGAPFLPTRQSDIESALDLLDLKPGETLLELGAGDGRLLVAAARRGWLAVGFEINPVLWLVATIRTWPYRALAKVRWGDYKQFAWPKRLGGIYIFGSKREMRFLDKKLKRLSHEPISVVSYGFELPGRKPDKTSGPFYVYKIK